MCPSHKKTARPHVLKPDGSPTTVCDLILVNPGEFYAV